MEEREETGVDFGNQDGGRRCSAPGLEKHRCKIAFGLRDKTGGVGGFGNRVTVEWMGLGYQVATVE